MNAAAADARTWPPWVTANSEVAVSFEDSAGALGHGTGHHTPVIRTIQRLVHFGVARWQRDALEIRQAVPMLSERQLRWLPLVLQAAHDQVLANDPSHQPIGRISYTY